MDCQAIGESGKFLERAAPDDMLRLLGGLEYNFT